MSGAVPLLPLYVFMVWIGKILPLPFHHVTQVLIKREYEVRQEELVKLSSDIKWLVSLRLQGAPRCTLNANALMPGKVQYPETVWPWSCRVWPSCPLCIRSGVGFKFRSMIPIRMALAVNP